MVALGAFIPNAPSDPTRIDAYAQEVGRMPAVVLWYEGWAGNTPFWADSARAAAQRGVVPVVTWESWDASQGPNQPQYKLTAITSGAYDPYVAQFARDIAAYGGPVYLRLDHEMNGNWYAWSTQAGNPNGNTPQDYVAAWRHVHDVFVQQGATNVRWVWCPNVENSATTPLADDYPGDQYVDWVGLDGYNWGTSQSWSSWQTFQQVFDDNGGLRSYDDLAALTQKPMGIFETASSELGGDKAAWIQDMEAQLPAFPRVRAVVWFNIQKETSWPVDSSPQALAAWQHLVADPYTHATLP